MRFKKKDPTVSTLQDLLFSVLSGVENTQHGLLLFLFTQIYLEFKLSNGKTLPPLPLEVTTV